MKHFILIIGLVFSITTSTVTIAQDKKTNPVKTEQKACHKKPCKTKTKKECKKKTDACKKEKKACDNKTKKNSCNKKNQKK